MGGEGQLHVANQTFALQANLCFVLPPGSAPRASHNPARRLNVLFVHFSLPENYPSLPPLLAVPVRDATALQAFALRLTQTAQNHRPGANRQAVVLLESLLWLLYDEKNAPYEPPSDVLVRKVAMQIQAAPGDDWPLDRQAEMAHLSRSQYGRRFRALYGGSPADWVIDARLNRAVQLLRESTLTVGEIADVLGYRDLFYFSRQFKQKKGVAPSSLRVK